MPQQWQRIALPQSCTLHLLLESIHVYVNAFALAANALAPL
jgi:hypothetical protein